GRTAGRRHGGYLGTVDVERRRVRRGHAVAELVGDVRSQGQRIDPRGLFQSAGETDPELRRRSAAIARVHRGDTGNVAGDIRTIAGEDVDLGRAKGTDQDRYIERDCGLRLNRTVGAAGREGSDGRRRDDDGERGREGRRQGVVERIGDACSDDQRIVTRQNFALSIEVDIELAGRPAIIGRVGGRNAGNVPEGVRAIEG